MTMKIGTALIGTGRWGKNIARELSVLGGFRGYASRTDAHNTHMAQIAPKVPRMDIEAICADSSVSAVVIATPIETHAALARQVLSAGKHVLVEKPAAADSVTAHELHHLAHTQDLIFATGYVLLYHPVYRELKRRLAGATIKSISCDWKKYGTFAEDIEMNLLTHHLALAYDLLGVPESVSKKRGIGVESACDHIDTTLHYGDVVFKSSIDRASPDRRHSVAVATDDGTFLWDGGELIERRNDGEQTVVYTSADQPLTCELESFLHTVQTGDTAGLPTCGDFGARVLELHEMLR